MNGTLRTHRPPATCPVCSDALITLRLGCPSCGTEVSGHFATCRYCRLDAADLAILEVFLRGRGNVRDVQAHLEVSYPTARVRLLEVLDRLGLGEPAPPEMASRPEPASPPETARPEPLSQPEKRGPAAPPSGSALEPAMVSAILSDLAAGGIDVARAEALLTQVPAVQHR